jgi:hypothetical protein
MMFNFPVSELPPPWRPTRRTALVSLASVGLALATAGCTKPQPRMSATAMIAGDALGPIYAETSTLIGAYDRAIAAVPSLTDLLGPLREEHRQHLIALASMIGLASPSIAPGPDPRGIPLPALTAAAIPTPSLPRSSPPGSSFSGSSVPGASFPAPAGASGVPASGPSAVAPSAATIAATKAALTTAEKAAQANAVAACVAAVDDRVAILAAIAACRATHVVVLS